MFVLLPSERPPLCKSCFLQVGHTFGACFFCFSLIEALFILATTMTKVPRQVDSSSAIHESIARGTIH
ncbi:uncharacterized protein LACBIDRAFT_299746 [Laccaria bicolor S238N-H82]|uniref:Predicted protein n=1 Tax=Laccaria bicolor (strain S238N-H82 / ATCC MYA-4686) TaxID=486041 RepID=B0DFC5_LACBS|nr:uncharacterized protein LACBIDRAFT_299746 [Laccaria bicolor S238N-H82]EDR06840.1 predicted protein [Laccaria bicolor S238N-H82]|eukprot:XP_001882687.1 predicted protein [Laccaria bicolor S238N-H82]